MKNTRGKIRLALALAALALTIGRAGAEDLSPNGARYANVHGSPLVTNGEIRFVNSAAGEVYTDVMQSSIMAQREFRRALPSIYSYSQTAHVVSQGPNITSDAAMASIAACPTSMCAPNNKWVMWDVPFSVRDTRKRDDGYLGFEQNIGGFATGLSRMLGETTAIGLAVGYDYRKLDGRDGYHMRNRADTFHAAIFGGTAVGCFFVDAYAGYSRSWHRTERHVEQTSGGDERNSGNYNDTVLSAGLKASYVWILPNDYRITPSVGVDYSHVRFGGVSEKGRRVATGGQSLSTLRLSEKSANQVQIPLMVAFTKTFTSNWFRFGGDCSLWTPEIRAGYIPVLGDKRTELTARNYVAGTDPYRVKSAEMGSYGDIGAGVKIKIRDRFIFSLDYDYRFASKYQSHTVTGSYGVSF